MIFLSTISVYIKVARLGQAQSQGPAGFQLATVRDFKGLCKLYI